MPDAALSMHKALLRSSMRTVAVRFVPELPMTAIATVIMLIEITLLPQWIDTIA